MKDRLQAPIRNARNIVIHQSLSDKFLDAFKIQVHSNARYRMRGDVTVSMFYIVVFVPLYPFVEGKTTPKKA